MRLTFDAPVTDHYFQFRCLPMEDDAQTVETLKVAVEPACAAHERIDGFGNRMFYGEILKPHDSLCVRMDARVRVDRKSIRCSFGKRRMRSVSIETPSTGIAGNPEPESEPVCSDTAEIAQYPLADSPAGEVPGIVYAYPSELTRPDQAMKEWLDVVWRNYASKYGSSAGGFISDGISCMTRNQAQVCFPEYLMHRLYQRLSYVQGQTHVGTTAAEAFALSGGVCQDYAHIFVAMCRLAGFPAKYVAGMAVGEGATHAWAEVWQDGAWTAYDPTHDCMADDRYIKLSHGRDFIDCSVDRGSFFGAGGQQQTVYVKVAETSTLPDMP